MPKGLFQRVALIVGALLLLLAAAVALFVATFDVNRLKPLAIEWMKAERSRTLAIDGPIELSLFPRLAIRVAKVHLSERARADEFASIDEASLSLRLLPLLKRELVVDRVAARGVRAVFTRDTRGFRNVDDLLQGDGGAPGPEGGPALRFDVGSVTLDDARLAVRDAMTDVEGSFQIASLVTGRLVAREETPVTVKAFVELVRPQPLRLAVDGSTTLALDIERNATRIALRDAKLKLGGNAAGLDDLQARLEGTLAWDGSALRAGPLALHVMAARSGELSLGASRLDLQRLVFSSATRAIEVERLTLALTGQRAAAPFELALDWPRLAVAGESLTGSEFSGRFKQAGALALDGHFESGAPTGGFESLHLPGFRVEAAGTQGARKIDATLKSNLVLRPNAAAARFEALELRASIAEPGLAPLQLALGGQVSAEADAAQWTLQGTLNSNRFDSQGNASFLRKGEPPRLQASARFDRLDVNQLLAPDKAPAAPATPATDTPLDLTPLNGWSGRFTLSAGQLVLRQVKVADARLEAALDAGVLRVSRLAGTAWGGQVEASGSADAKARRIALKLNATGVDVNALLKDVAGKDLLAGTGRVSADMASTGASLNALRSNLAGSVALQLRDGAVKGLNLARALRQAKAALAQRHDAMEKARATEQTDFSELSASALIANGVAQSKDLDLRSPFLRGSGAGEFDIGRGRIDYTARVAVTGAPTGQDGADLAALRGVTVPVRLAGSFDAIEWNIQWSAVAAAAVEFRLRDKLRELLGK
jgi:AsmA protein